MLHWPTYLIFKYTYKMNFRQCIVSILFKQKTFGKCQESLWWPIL